MKKRMYYAIIVAIVMTITSLLGGCKPAEKTGSSNSAYKTHVKIRLMSRDLYHNESQTIQKDEVVKFFEKKFNCEFEFLYVPSPSQTEVFEKLNMMLATGDVPDIIEMRNDSTLPIDIYESLIANDQLVNIEEYINNNSGKYPAIEKLVKDPQSEAYRSRSTGKLSIIPRSFGTIDHGFILRKDWLDKLGLSIPQTTDDLYNVLKEFVKKDPEGTKNVGLTLPSTWWLGQIYVGFTGSWNWIAQNGSYQYTMATENQRDAFKYLNKLYKEGLLDKEIFTSKGESDAIAKFTAGLSGATMMGVSFSTPSILTALKKSNPNAELAYVNIKGPKAYCRLDIPSFFEGSVINKNAPDVGRLFDMIEYILSPEGEQIMRHGIEGIHYTKNADGTIKKNIDVLKSEGWDGRTHGLRAMFNVEPVIDADSSENYKDVIAFIDSLKQPGQMVKDPLFGVITNAEKEVGSRPWDVAGKYTIGFITGDYKLDSDWNTFKEEFYSKGMQKIQDEINSKYKP